MIETVMIFGLGFLAASLCGLLILPAVNARAARLSRRRIEAGLPLSISEVAAEKDYLRAQFAVAQRRLERKVEAARSSRQADMAAIGARTVEAAALARTVEERDAAIAKTRAMLGDVERELETARSEGALGSTTLQVLEEAHREALDDLRAIRHERLVPANDLERTAPDPVALPDAITVPDPAARHADLIAERETLRVSLAAAEDALAALMARRDGDTDELRRRISDVADTLMQRERLPKASAFTVSARS